MQQKRKSISQGRSIVRAELPVAPRIVTQRTAQQVLGLTERQYLDIVRRHGHRLGRATLGKVVATIADRWPLLLVELGDEPRDAAVGTGIRSEADVWARAGRGAK
jgi:hypothetical protein